MRLQILLLFTSLASFLHAFKPSVRRLRVNGPKSMSMAAPPNTAHTVVLIRHGESTWNNENKFTGWADVPLSSHGVSEAEMGGKLLKDAGFQFDIAYTSYLKRAISTLWICLTALDQMYLPVVHSWRLNERHYGALQGLDKQETVDKYGKDQVLIWRRSYDIPPPDCDKSSEHYPGKDPKYKDVPGKDLPLAESLKLTEERFMVEWDKTIAPKIKSGETVLIAAHGNTLRALVKYLDNIPPEDITELNIPTAVPLVYYLDANLKPLKCDVAMAPLSGEYLGNQEEIRNRIEGVKNQTK